MASARTIKQALRDYCNLKTDLDELSDSKKRACAEDKVFCADLKRQLQEYMQAQHIDCLLDTASDKFLCRMSRSSPKPLSESMRDLILKEIGDAEREGKLKFIDIDTLILDVITLIQKLRTNKTEMLKITDKKPSSVGDAVIPSVQEVQTMLASYIEVDAKISALEESAKGVEKDLKDKLTQVVPLVEDYCKSHSVIKKPMNFPRRMSSEFTSCITKFEPEYFSRVKNQSARRFLQYKQSKSRARKVTTLRPSKKHMVEVLGDLTASKKSGWSHVKLVQSLFDTLQQEAEDLIAKKLQKNEDDPVFKVSLCGKVNDDDE